MSVCVVFFISVLTATKTTLACTKQILLPLLLDSLMLTDRKTPFKFAETDERREHYLSFVSLSQSLATFQAQQ